MDEDTMIRLAYYRKAFLLATEKLEEADRLLVEASIKETVCSQEEYQDIIMNQAISDIQMNGFKDIDMNMCIEKLKESDYSIKDLYSMNREELIKVRNQIHESYYDLGEKLYGSDFYAVDLMIAQMIGKDVDGADIPEDKPHERIKRKDVIDIEKER